MTEPAERVRERGGDFREPAGLRERVRLRGHDQHREAARRRSGRGSGEDGLRNCRLDGFGLPAPRRTLRRRLAAVFLGAFAFGPSRLGAGSRFAARALAGFAGAETGSGFASSGTGAEAAGPGRSPAAARLSPELPSVCAFSLTRCVEFLRGPNRFRLRTGPSCGIIFWHQPYAVNQGYRNAHFSTPGWAAGTPRRPCRPRSDGRNPALLESPREGTPGSRPLGVEGIAELRRLKDENPDRRPRRTADRVAPAPASGADTVRPAVDQARNPIPEQAPHGGSNPPVRAPAGELERPSAPFAGHRDGDAEARCAGRSRLPAGGTSRPRDRALPEIVRTWYEAVRPGAAPVSPEAAGLSWCCNWPCGPS